MKTKYILLTLWILCGFSGFSQEKKDGFFKKHPFVNITEFGVLLGRNKVENVGWWGIRPANYLPSYSVQNRINASIQSFNGVYLSKKTAVGITVGVDGYGQTVLMPISAGIRQQLIKKKEGGSILLGSLDAGYATTWLNEDQTGYITKGGIMVNPMIGYKLPMRNGSSWIINFGYRYQQATYEQERQQADTPYWYESLEKRNYRRMVVRFGIEF